MEANIESLDDLRINLAEQAMNSTSSLHDPVQQARSLERCSLGQYEQSSEFPRCAWFEVARLPAWRLRTLKNVAKQVLVELKKHY